MEDVPVIPYRHRDWLVVVMVSCLYTAASVSLFNEVFPRNATFLLGSPHQGKQKPYRLPNSFNLRWRVFTCADSAPPAQGHRNPLGRSFCGICAEDCAHQEMQSAQLLQRSRGSDDKIGHD